MAKERGIFGKKITFSITAPARCSAGGQAAAAAAPPPPPGGIRNSPDKTPGLQYSPTKLSTPPPTPPQPKNSWSTTTAPQRPPFPLEVRHTPKNSSSATMPPPRVVSSSPRNSSSTTTTPAPSTSFPGLSPSPPKDPSPQPPALPLASTSSSPSCATIEDEGIVQSHPLLTGDESINSRPFKLLASKRTYLPSPNVLNNAAAKEGQFFHHMTTESQVPNNGAGAKEKDEGASIGIHRNRDGLLELASQEPSKIKEQKTECDYQDQNEDTEENDHAVSFKLLASNKIYPHRPVLLKTLQCKSLTEVVKHKSYRKTGSSSSQQNDLASHSADNSIKCCCHTHPMSRLDQFLLKRELTKTIELPGTSRSCRVTTSARLEIRLILRRSIRLIYKLHREGYSLEGSFGLRSFWVDDNLFVTLEYKEEDRKNYSKQGARKDLQSFVKMVQSEIFGSQDMPSEIMRWLSLIQKGGTDYEYLISYDCALMEHNQILSTFMQLYSKLQTMKKSDYIGYKFVLDELKHFNGWSGRDLHNQYFTETYLGRDKKKRKWRDRGRWKRSYGTDVMSLLRLIRNTFQHITLKRFDKSGNIIFDEENYEYILDDQFPRILPEFMEAMYIAAYLADLNLEHVMV
ncbi:unnamed protein product [Miscanthus lutarioriparius]|uniref:KEN domain-containing protein n=1 Tax=Miscanthus lutarioriparius TaxID=422564 RepID=A0A811QPU9_9POAL|nr:unnamed protein product [Miscanthus lutarioriparius]